MASFQDDIDALPVTGMPSSPTPSLSSIPAGNHGQLPSANGFDGEAQWSINARSEIKQRLAAGEFRKPNWLASQEEREAYTSQVADIMSKHRVVAQANTFGNRKPIDVAPQSIRDIAPKAGAFQQGAESFARGATTDFFLPIMGNVAPDFAADSMKSIEEFAPLDDTSTNTFLRGVGSAVPSVALAATGGPAVAGGVGFLQGSGAARIDVANAPTPVSGGEEIASMLLYGGAAGASEFLQAKVIQGISRTFGPSATKNLMQSAMAGDRAGVAAMIQRYLVSSAIQAPMEAVQEATEQIVQNATQQYVMGQDVSLTQGVGDAALGGLGGGLVGGGVGGFNANRGAKNSRNFSRNLDIATRGLEVQPERIDQTTAGRYLPGDIVSTPKGDQVVVSRDPRSGKLIVADQYNALTTVDDFDTTLVDRPKEVFDRYSNGGKSSVQGNLVDSFPAPRTGEDLAIEAQRRRDKERGDEVQKELDINRAERTGQYDKQIRQQRKIESQREDDQLTADENAEVDRRQRRRDQLLADEQTDQEAAVAQEERSAQQEDQYIAENRDDLQRLQEDRQAAIEEETAADKVDTLKQRAFDLQERQRLADVERQQQEASQQRQEQDLLERRINTPERLANEQRGRELEQQRDERIYQEENQRDLNLLAEDTVESRREQAAAANVKKAKLDPVRRMPSQDLRKLSDAMGHDSSQDRKGMVQDIRDAVDNQFENHTDKQLWDAVRRMGERAGDRQQNVQTLRRLFGADNATATPEVSLVQSDSQTQNPQNNRQDQKIAADVRPSVRDDIRSADEQMFGKPAAERGVGEPDAIEGARVSMRAAGYDDNIEHVDPIDNVEREIVRQSKARGQNAVFARHRGKKNLEGYSGFYHKPSNTIIYSSGEAGQSLVRTLNHEWVHALSRGDAEAYQAVVEAIPREILDRNRERYAMAAASQQINTAADDEEGVAVTAEMVSDLLQSPRLMEQWKRDLSPGVMATVRRAVNALVGNKPEGQSPEVRRQMLKAAVAIRKAMDAPLAEGGEGDTRAAIRDKYHSVGAERGERETGRAALDKDELAVVKEFEKKKEFAEYRGKLEERARVAKRGFPTKAGWMPIKLTGFEIYEEDKSRRGEPAKIVKQLLPVFQKIPYQLADGDFETMVNGVVEEMRDLRKRADAGDAVAKNIIAQESWYRGMRDRIRREFGGMSDQFADLLAAFSPGTGVAVNWDNAVEAIDILSKGGYDDILKQFAQRLDRRIAVNAAELKARTDAGLKIRVEDAKFSLVGDRDEVENKIAKGNNKLYGFNSINGMIAMVDLWRRNSPGTAPKARNFGGNLIGLTNDATIDVWAARLLRRKAGFPRIPPPAEGAVSGVWTIGKITGDFGYGQKVFAEAAKRLGFDPDGLQAVVWFSEKEQWTKNDWTSTQGEGGSFEHEMEQENLRRYVVGASVTNPNTPDPQLADQVRGASHFDNLKRNREVIALKINTTTGMYMGDKERSIDVELVVGPKFNKADVLDSAARLGKAENQDAMFVSRVIKDNESLENAVPGIEVYFDRALTPQEAEPYLEKLRSLGVKGMTFVTSMHDPRMVRMSEPGKFIGVRTQFIPQFEHGSEGWGKMSHEEKQGNVDKWHELFVGIQETMNAEKGVAHASQRWYDTTVLERTTYDSFRQAEAIPSMGGAEVRQGLQDSPATPVADRGGEQAGVAPPDVRNGRKARNRKGGGEQVTRPSIRDITPADGNSGYGDEFFLGKSLAADRSLLEQANTDAAGQRINQHNIFDDAKMRSLSDEDILEKSDLLLAQLEAFAKQPRANANDARARHNFAMLYQEADRRGILTASIPSVTAYLGDIRASVRDTYGKIEGPSRLKRIIDQENADEDEATAEQDRIAAQREDPRSMMWSPTDQENLGKMTRMLHGAPEFEMVKPDDRAVLIKAFERDYDRTVPQKLFDSLMRRPVLDRDARASVRLNDEGVEGRINALGNDEGAGRTSPQQRPTATGEYRPPTRSDLGGDFIDLWHGTTKKAWSKIRETGSINEGQRGKNASADVSVADQFPEDTGAEILIVVRTNPQSLSVDPNDQIGETVEDGLFPKGFGSSATLGDHSVVAAFDVSSAKGDYRKALQAGDFAKAKKLGVKQLSFNQSAPAGSGGDIRAAVRLNPESTTELILRKVQDSMNPVSRLQRDVKASGGKISDDSDPYLRQELFPGRVGDAFKQLDEEHIQPLIQAMKDDGITTEDLDRYVTALHAPERNATIAQRNPAMADGGSGIKTADAQAYIAGIPAAKKGKLAALSQRVRDINDNTLRLQVGAGLITPAEYTELSTRWQYYVPLRTDMEEDGFNLKRGRGFDIRGRESKAALGRGEGNIADSPVMFSLMAAHEKIVRAEKNLVGQNLLKLLEDNPDPDLWTINQHPTIRTLGSNGQVKNIIDPTFRQKDNVLIVKRGGEEQVIEFKTPDSALVARAMKNLGADSTARMVRMIQKPMQIFKNLQTSWNPEFLIPNLVRDLQTAVGTMSAEQTAGMAKRMVMGVPKSIRALYDIAGDRNAGAGQGYHDYAREFLATGAKVDSFHLDDFAATSDRVNRIFRTIDPKTPKDKFLNAMRKASDWVDRLNSAVENGVRLSAYVEARKSGMTAERAASMAKNLTVNFNRKGEWGGNLNTLYVFANASVQGNATLYRAIYKSKRGRKIAGGVFGSGLAYGLIAPALFGDDDRDRSEYDKLGEWEKSTHIILPGGGKIPLPYGFNVLFSAGRNMGEVLSGHNTAGKAALNVVTSAAGAFSPINAEGSPIQTLTPTILDPVIQQLENKNWNGREIVPTQSWFENPKPNSQLYTRRNNQLLVSVSQWLNSLTGGDEVTPGMVDIAPGRLEHLVDFLSGGAGRFVKRVGYDLPADIASGNIQSKNLPIAQRFISRPNEDLELNVFRDNIREIEDAASDLKHYRESRQSEKVSGLLGSDRGVYARSGDSARNYLKTMKRLREREDEAKEAGDMAQAEELHKKQLNLAAKFNQRFRK